MLTNDFLRRREKQLVSGTLSLSFPGDCSKGWLVNEREEQRHYTKREFTQKLLMCWELSQKLVQDEATGLNILE